jgi:cytosine/adenosine deaminase-related metal-dependent hydrolase
MGLSAMDPLIGLAEGTDADFNILDDRKCDALLAVTGMATDRA